ncbi:MAG: hypothetical protein H6R19_2757 [Proteobacteria bacterium]|nr:hypothetical protein [Pseudomonadota bacterium]
MLRQPAHFYVFKVCDAGAQLCKQGGEAGSFRAVGIPDETHNDIAVTAHMQLPGSQCEGEFQGGKECAGFGFVVAALPGMALREVVGTAVRTQQEGAKADVAGVRAGGAVTPGEPAISGSRRALGKVLHARKDNGEVASWRLCFSDEWN